MTQSYGGNWTALFYTGGARAFPAALSGEGVYLFPGSTGYDGQFYHYVAHDPLLRGDMPDYIDAARLRYRRILMPAAAYLMSAGRDKGIDFALVATSHLAFFLGTYWLARFSVLAGRAATWGLVFLAFPASVISLDRLTVDLPLGAFCCGLLAYQREGFKPGVWLTLAASCLTRETGFLLLAGVAFAAAARREWRWTGTLALGGVPALAWYAYVHAHTSGYELNRPDWQWPPAYPLDSDLASILAALDAVSYGGALLAIAITLRGLRRRSAESALAPSVMFALLPLAAGTLVAWYEPFGYPRVLSPLFALLTARAIESGSLLPAVPLLLALPRLFAQVLPKSFGV